MNDFQWIKNHFDSRQNQSWNRLKDIIPPIFDDYFLVHWKVGIVKNFPFDDYPEDNFSIENINKRVKIDREFNLFLNPEKDQLFEEVSLNYLSKRFNVPKNENILSNIKDTPAIEILTKQSQVAIKNSLEKIAKNQDLYFYIEDIFRLEAFNVTQQEYSRYKISEYIKFQESIRYDFNTYLFTKNLDWCLTTSEDLPMFLCTKKNVTEKMKKQFDLELIKVDYDKIIN